MPKKKDKFYITKSYNSLKSHKKGDLKDCSNETYTLILKLQETSPVCLTDLFISRLIYISV